jgi:subtilisin family serine protease
MQYHPSWAPRRAILLAVALVVGAVPTARAAAPDTSDRRPYVVILKDRTANAKAVADDHRRRFGVDVKMLYDRGLRGYAGVIADRDAERLAREPGVVIAPDTEVSAFEATGSPEVLSGQPTPYYTTLPTGWGWGLDRIDQHPSLAAYGEKDRYHYTETAIGVTAYVIDSGVNTNHQEFDRARASAGFDALRPTSDARWGQDCNGHGTHVAGILGGRTFGVAKDVKIVSVRVLDCNGSGTVSNVVAGINYLTGVKKANSAKVMVANMSLGGSANSALDQAVRDSIATGITYSISAGNGNVLGTGQDACNVSPARVATALTVGATDSTDKKTSWSNYGSCVDVYAPGNGIVSSYGATTDPAAWRSLSGTSMSAPAVAGVAALLLQIDAGASPGQVSQTVATLATPNAVTNQAGAKLLYAPWTGPDVIAAADKLNDPVSTPPPPPPPPSCFILCLFG